MVLNLRPRYTAPLVCILFQAKKPQLHFFLAGLLCKQVHLYRLHIALSFPQSVR